MGVQSTWKHFWSIQIRASKIPDQWPRIKTNFNEDKGDKIRHPPLETKTNIQNLKYLFKRIFYFRFTDRKWCFAYHCKITRTKTCWNNSAAIQKQLDLRKKSLFVLVSAVRRLKADRTVVMQHRSVAGFATPGRIATSGARLSCVKEQCENKHKVIKK